MLRVVGLRRTWFLAKRTRGMFLDERTVLGRVVCSRTLGVRGKRMVLNKRSVLKTKRSVSKISRSVSKTKRSV
jgi:hypothetical protein